MDEQRLMAAIFEVVEFLTKMELSDTAKMLINNYYRGSTEPRAGGRARASVLRYTQCPGLPRLEEMRQKKREQLDKLEHLVLKMEYEAQKVDAPDAPPAAPSPHPAKKR